MRNIQLEIRYYNKVNVSSEERNNLRKIIQENCLEKSAIGKKQS